MINAPTLTARDLRRALIGMDADAPVILTVATADELAAGVCRDGELVDWQKNTDSLILSAADRPIMATARELLNEQTI